MKKIVFTSIALATLAASPAFAATHKRVINRAPLASEAYVADAYTSVDPYAVVVEGQIVGRDPDPAIRGYILKDNSVNAD